MFVGRTNPIFMRRLISRPVSRSTYVLPLNASWSFVRVARRPCAFVGCTSATESGVRNAAESSRSRPLQILCRNHLMIRATGDPSSQSSLVDVEPSSQRAGIGNKSLVDQLGHFIAEHNDLRVAYDQLQSERNHLRAGSKEVRARLKCVTRELAAIRADLGTIAAVDVRYLVSEREELRAKIQSLGDENRNLHHKESISEESISQLENRVRELAPFRERHDSLAETIELQDAELNAVRAERDDLARNLSEKNDELVATRSELVQLTQQFEQSDTGLQAACQERQQLIEQLDLCKDDLNIARDELRRISSERQSARDTVERLTTTLAERGRTIRNQRDQFDAELESNRQAFCLAERSFHVERETLTVELAAVCAGISSFRSSNSPRKRYSSNCAITTNSSS